MGGQAAGYSDRYRRKTIMTGGEVAAAQAAQQEQSQGWLSARVGNLLHRGREAMAIVGSIAVSAAGIVGVNPAETAFAQGSGSGTEAACNDIHLTNTAGQYPADKFLPAAPGGKIGGAKAASE